MEVYIVTRTEYFGHENDVQIDCVFSNQESAEAYCHKMNPQLRGQRDVPTYEYEQHIIEN